MTFALDAARLGRETQEVMALRLLKLARGGHAAKVEAQRMMTEKGFAFAYAAATLATGGSMKNVSTPSTQAREPKQAALVALPLGAFASVATERRAVANRHSHNTRTAPIATGSTHAFASLARRGRSRASSSLDFLEG